jgi:hypothetical protein
MPVKSPRDSKPVTNARGATADVLGAGELWLDERSVFPQLHASRLTTHSVATTGIRVARRSAAYVGGGLLRGAEVAGAEQRRNHIAVLAATQPVRRLGRTVEDDFDDLDTVDPLITEPTAHCGSEVERRRGRHDPHRLLVEDDLSRIYFRCCEHAATENARASGLRWHEPATEVAERFGECGTFEAVGLDLFRQSGIHRRDAFERGRDPGGLGRERVVPGYGSGVGPRLEPSGAFDLGADRGLQRRDGLDQDGCLFRVDLEPVACREDERFRFLASASTEHPTHLSLGEPSER